MIYYPVSIAESVPRQVTLEFPICSFGGEEEKQRCTQKETALEKVWNKTEDAASKTEMCLPDALKRCMEEDGT